MDLTKKLEKIKAKYSGHMDFEYFNNGCIKHKSYGEDDESIERKNLLHINLQYMIRSKIFLSLRAT